MPKADEYVLYSGAAAGTEAFFGEMAERYGVQEVNYTFEGHQAARNRGLRVLTLEELSLKDVSLTYVSRLMNRQYTRAPLFRKVLQSICWQVSSGDEVFAVGEILEDGTVKGGTGWGAEFAKICNKPLWVFDQKESGWRQWEESAWKAVNDIVITSRHFTATGSRFLESNGKQAIEELFRRTFG